MVQIMENYNIFKMFTVIAMLTTVFENSHYEFSKSVVTMATPVNPSCAKRSLMRVLSALSVVFQVSAQ